MRIVTTANRTGITGGVELNVFQVDRELARRGHELHLLYVEEGALVPEYQEFCRSTIRVPRVEYPYRRAPWKMAPDVARIIPTVGHALRRRPDVYYANRIFSSGWLMPAGILGRVPAVCHVHGFSQLGLKRTARISRHVDRFVMISQFVAQPWLEAGMDPTKVEVVHNGIDPAEYPFGGEPERQTTREALGISADAFVVTYFGRLDPGKGLEVLLDAWSRLAYGPNEATLILLGSPILAPDPERHLADLKARATESVRFMAMQRDVMGPLHAADVVVVPTTDGEPFGRVVIEALATGRPVVGSDGGAIPEILGGDFARFLFEPGNAAMLAERLEALVGWRAREPKLGVECADWVAQNFTLAQTVDGLERAFAAVT